MDDKRPDEEMIRDDDSKMERRLFLQSLGKWSCAAIAAATGSGVWLGPKANAAWVNRRGGGGGWVNRAGWVNGGGGWINRSGGGGGWVNRRGGGGKWVNRR